MIIGSENTTQAYTAVNELDRPWIGWNMWCNIKG